MKLSFSTRKLARECSENTRMQKVHGLRRAKVLQRRLAQLSAAPALSALGLPYTGPGRCHELSGNRKGQFTIDLDGPYRLVFRCVNEPEPRNVDGGFDWSGITEIEIISIEDTHE